jgi:hypothetical protein
MPYCECGCQSTIQSPDRKGRLVRFKKGHRAKRPLWTPDTWTVGTIRMSAGPRFIVYRPDYPKADAYGRAVRAHVVWWLETGQVLPPGYVVHHINENTLEDHKWNLALLTAKEHSRHHHEKNAPVVLRCEQCSKDFTVQYNIINQHLKEGRKYGQRFCSKPCADEYRRGKRGHSIYGLTPAKVREIRRFLGDATKRSSRCKEAAARFGISVRSVYAIKSRQNWADVEG